MSIKLKWLDNNALVDGFRVYRSTTPIDDTALPTPLATVGAAVFEYTDNTAVRNVLYYYKIGAYLGGEEALTPNRPLSFMPYTGPGPQSLLRGDYAVGFFGEIPFDDLISIDDFKTIYGLTWATATVKPTAWLKFVINNKILFFPNAGGLSNAMTVQQVYQAGLMYGTNDDTLYSASLKSSFGVINQIRPLTKGDHVFIPRCPISRADRTSQATGTALKGGEVDTVLGSAFIGRTTLVEYPLVLGDYLNDSSYFLTCDTYSAGATAVTRGTVSFDAQSSAALTSGGVAHYRPVLELVL